MGDDYKQLHELPAEVLAELHADPVRSALITERVEYNALLEIHRTGTPEERERAWARIEEIERKWTTQ